jgi:hypothetical protein
VDGTTLDKLTKRIVNSLVEYGNASEAELAHKLVCFEIDGITIF